MEQLLVIAEECGAEEVEGVDGDIYVGWCSDDVHRGCALGVGQDAADVEVLLENGQDLEIGGVEGLGQIDLALVHLE